jgi:hypothetical protein
VSPDAHRSEARGRAALEALRAAVPGIASAYRAAEGDKAVNMFGNGRRSRRDTRYHDELVRAWQVAQEAFVRACAAIEPEIDASLRLADVRAMGETLIERLRQDEEGAMRPVIDFDRHIHELFDEIRRHWPELADTPALPQFNDDELALQAPWLIALRRNPVALLGVVVVFGMFAYEFVRIVFLR